MNGIFLILSVLNQKLMMRQVARLQTYPGEKINTAMMISQNTSTINNEKIVNIFDVKI
jgi:hypothetical protein